MRHLVFVYGTLKRGFGNHPRFMKNEQPVCSTATIKAVMVDLGPFPAVREGNGTVTGELYLVSKESLEQQLDRLEGHPNYYRRRQVEVQTPHGNQWAWVYFAYRIPTNYAPIIPNGIWTKGYQQCA